MARDSAWLTIISASHVSGACELCSTESTRLESRVTVRHAHGGLAQFAACSTCTRAMRRIAAVVGSEATVTDATTVAADSAASPATEITHRPPQVEHAELLAELTERFTSTDGKSYAVRIWGGPRSEGTWAGWLEFGAVDGSDSRRTGQETTQPDRDKVLYWTTGLGPAYFQGAFARAR